MRSRFALVLATMAVFASLGIGSVDAAQVTVTQVDNNADGTTTYHFAIKVGDDETMGPATGADLPADFVTVYNFYGLVDGSAKTPEGWQFSSEPSGRTPAMGGYPLVLPVDIPGTPNLTWTAAAPIKPDTEVTGFSATTRVGTMTDGMYSAQVTQRAAPIKSASGSPGSGVMVSKQAQIGMIETPSFLLELKK
jgi:hypothetical protein